MNGDVGGGKEFLVVVPDQLARPERRAHKDFAKGLDRRCHHPVEGEETDHHQAERAEIDDNFCRAIPDQPMPPMSG